MTLNCTFLVAGVKSTGEREVLRTVKNVITTEGLKYLAGAQKFKTAEMPSEFGQYVNCVFLGSGTRPTSISDSGLEQLELILPTGNYNNYSGVSDTFTSMPIAIPAGTYTEVAMGYYDPVTDTKHYYNRAVFDTPLVVDATYYQTWKAIEVRYDFGMEATIASWGRKSVFDVAGVNYTASIYTRRIAPWQESSQFKLFETDKGGVTAGPLYTNGLDATIKRLSPAPDNVAVYEIAIKNTSGVPKLLEWLQFRTGNFLNIALIYNNANKEEPLTLANNETVTLQFEFHYLANYPTEHKVAVADSYEGSADNPLRLTSSSVNYNPASFKSAFTINAETGARLNYTPAQIDGSSDFVNYLIPENQRESRPEYLKTDYQYGNVPAKTTEIVKLFGVDFGTREHFIRTSIGTITDTFTYGQPNYTYSASLTNTVTTETGRGIILNTKPSNADQVVVYDAYLDKMVRLDIFKTAGNQDAVIIPANILGHDVNETVAIKYSNKANTALKGVWKVLGVGGINGFHEYAPVLADIPAVTTLARVGVMTTPIIGFKYNRTTKRLSGYVLNATKIKILGQDGNTEVHEFDVTPNKEFDIDLSTVEMSVAVNYKFVAWDATTGNSEGPVYNGFVSISIAPITDAVYDANARTITFTRPAAYIKYAVLRRWDFDFYRIELQDGQNTLNLTSALDENGQWELIALDEMNGEAVPFYIFGEKPGDIPVKPPQSAPVITPDPLNTSQSYKTANIGFYIDKSPTVRKWWEGVEWFGSINDTPATVEFMGIAAKYPFVEGQANTNWVPFLSFKLKAGDLEFAFELNVGNGVTPGYWSVNGSYYQSRATIKLWHDWIVFDGNTDSELYYQSRTTNNKIYGTGNGYQQVTEIQSGFIRRGVGLILNTNDEPVIGGACPVNFDAELSNSGTSVPTLAQHSPFMNVVLGNAVYQNGDSGVIRKDQVGNYTVLINNKLATATVIEDVEWAGSTTDYCKAITWENVDGVAYRFDLPTWTFARTDRDLHSDDPAYQEIVDTIQLCYAYRANPQWYNHWAFQSDATGGRGFAPNIRQLNYGSYWQSVKGWLRPYYKPNALLELTPGELTSTSNSPQVIPFDFDLSLLDDGNEMQYFLNDEPAVLEEVVLPQQIISWGAEASQYLPVDQRATIVASYKTGPALYKDNIVAISPSYKSYYSDWQNFPQEDWYSNQGIIESIMVDNNKTIYELYRNRLPNASDYLSYDELLTALYVRNNSANKSIAIDLALLAPELLTKKLLVPIVVNESIKAGLEYGVANSSTDIVFAPTSNDTTGGVNTADYLTGINNPGLADTTKIIPVSFGASIIGHRSFDLVLSNHNCYMSFWSPSGSGNTSQSEYTYVKITNLTDIPDDIDGYGLIKVNDIYNFPTYHYQGYMFTVSSSNAQFAKALSYSLFGEDRGYETFTDRNLISKSGLFNLPYARSKGLTGKYLLATIVNNRLPALTEYVNANPEADPFFISIPREDNFAYAKAIIQDKPICGWWAVINHVEIDLSKTDEELALITDKTDVMWVGGAPAISRVGISADGFDRYFVEPVGGFGTNLKTGMPLTASGLNAVVIETSLPINIRRKLVSANYTLEEVSRFGLSQNELYNDNNWFITRGLEVNDKVNNKLYWKGFKVTVKTKKFNSKNIFAKSRTSPWTKTIGNDTGHYLNIGTMSYSVAANTLVPQMVDPRIYPSMNSYSSNSSFSALLFKLMAYVRGNGYVGLSDQFGFACNGKMMQIIPAADAPITYANWNTNDFFNNKVIAKLVDDVTGEHIANLVASITGYQQYSAFIEMVTEVPDLYLFTFVIHYSDSTMRNIINNLYIANEINSGSYFASFTQWVYDYNNPPPLDPVNIDPTANIDFAITPVQFAEANGDIDLPFPGWNLVETTEDFLANFNIIVNGQNTIDVVREEVVDVYNSISINAVKYTITSAAITFALYYATGDDIGGYRGEVISINDNSLPNIVIAFEATKTSVNDQGHPAFVTQFARYFPVDAMYNIMSGTDSQPNPSWLASGRIYYTQTTDYAFSKMTGVIIIANNNFVDETLEISNAWLSAIDTSTKNFVGFASGIMGAYDPSWDEIEQSDKLVPIPVYVDGVFVANGKPLTEFNNMATPEGFNFFSNNADVLDIAFDVNFNADMESEVPPETIEPSVWLNYWPQGNTMDKFNILSFVTVPPDDISTGPSGPSEGPMMMSLEGGPPPLPFAGMYIASPDALTDMDGIISPYLKIMEPGQFGMQATPFGNILSEEQITNSFNEATATIYHFAVVNPEMNVYAVENMATVSSSTEPGTVSPLIWMPKGPMYYYDGPFKHLKAFTEDGTEILRPSYEHNGDGPANQSMTIRFEDEPSQEVSNYYYQRWTEVWNGSVSSEYQSRNSKYANSRYFDIYYATSWIGDGHGLDVGFFNRADGQVMTYEDALLLAESSTNISIHRETRTVMDGEVELTDYRWFIWERIINEGYTPTLDRDVLDPVEYAESLLLNTNPDDPRIVPLFTDADRLGKDHFPVPNLNVFYFTRTDPIDTTEFFLPLINADALNAMFHMEIDGVMGVWGNVVYTDDPRVLSFDWVHPSITISYVIENPYHNVEGNYWNTILFNAATSSAVFTEGVNTVNLFCALKVWLNGMVDVDVWAPYGYFMTGAEIIDNSPSIYSTGVYTVTAVDEAKRIEVDSSVIYYINETRVLPGEREAWPDVYIDVVFDAPSPPPPPEMPS